MVSAVCCGKPCIPINPRICGHSAFMDHMMRHRCASYMCKHTVAGACAGRNRFFVMQKVCQRTIFCVTNV